MKNKKYLFLFLSGIVSLVFFSSVYAQPAIRGQGPAAVGTTTECNDLSDNDKDGLIDLKDKQCTSIYIACEDGTTSCIKKGSSSNSGLNINLRIKNPLTVNTIEEAIKKVMDVIVMISIPIIIIMFIVAGFMYIFARGDTGAITKAHNTFLYTLIGALLILGAWTIAAAIVGTVNMIAG